ncbi:tetratricopeptide repeat protein [Sphingobacterium bovistauri]|uniref:Tetratricopeptide repeat-containing protein n=1 Tax=Sphingobacterium bovistauri TaxID=2781959 RepID=A0ABS7Z5U3_9SPHI|nr:hypothetical protein [Sphingobacterium bovistauri]MCA5004766.1 hypothetical protein [Sphingobacterium bovistauri]
MKFKNPLILTLLIFFLLTKISLASTIGDIINIKDKSQQIEAILTFPLNFGKDTTSLKKNLQPLLVYAQENENISLQWAYYIRIADGFSIAFDNTNPTSDRYYTLARNILGKHDFIELEMITYIRQGYYNFVYRKVVNAFPFFLHANHLKSKVRPNKIPHILEHYQFTSAFYRYIGDYHQAIEYLNEALPYALTSSRMRINHINSIAILNEDLQQEDKAVVNYNEALKVANELKDSVWIGIIYGNLSKFEWQKGNKTKAIELLKENIRLSTKFEEHHDAMRSHIELGNYYIAMQMWNSAKYHIISSIHLMQDKPFYLQHKMEAQHALAKIANGFNQIHDQVTHLNNYIQLRDSIDIINDSKEIQRTIWQSEKDRYIDSIGQIEEKRKNTIRLFLFTIALFLLIFSLIVLLINKSKARIKIKNAALEKDQLKINYEKKLLDQEMLILQQSLNEFTNTIQHNNETIKQLKKEIITETKGDQPQVKDALDQLNNLLQSHIMTDERWIQFKFVFNKVYPNYLSLFKEKYPKITENDQKLLALQKLNLSNNVMSDLLCISVEGIKKAKQRLKKKIE